MEITEWMNEQKRKSDWYQQRVDFAMFLLISKYGVVMAHVVKESVYQEAYAQLGNNIDYIIGNLYKYTTENWTC